MVADKVILLVEDNDDDEELTLRALEKQAITNDVVVARTGEEAIDLLFGTGGARRERIRPQVVLLDLNLPKMNGLDVLRRIRAERETRHLPVVVLTSSKEDEDVLSSYSLGANAYVRKPVDFGQFSEAVRTLGRFWLQLNELAPERSSTS
jgi:two-component system, response regulator